MCGLVSVLSRGAPIERAAMTRALAALRHRGPDGEGLWLAEDRRVALGHRRLAIVDLDGGAQPIANEDGSVVAIVNGEIYEDDRLRRELAARGHRVRTRSDSELLVHLYEELGPDGLLRELGGELAFVLWDARRRTLYAGRDRYGIKPLCYAALGEGVAIASEAKALFALGVPVRWDREAFAHVACLQYAPIDRTLFDGVRAVPPGALLAIDARGTRLTRGFDDLEPPDETGPPLEEAAAQVRARLERSVARRMRADVPIGAQLSGGVDSTSVAALAARHRSLPCFTVRFAGEYDESAAAQRTAAALGLPLHVVGATDRALADALPDAVACSEGLAVNVHLPAKLLLARAIRAAGCKVVLSGEGADEAFLGYPHLRADRWAGDAERVAAANPASRGLMMPAGEAPPELAEVEARLGGAPTFLRAKAALGLRLRSLGSDALRDAVRECAPFSALAPPGDLARLRALDPVDRASRLWTRLALGGYILRTLGDGAEMGASIEGRVPFLDPSVFEYARRLPIELRMRGDVDKPVLREAVRGAVPPEVLARRKHPFVGPPIDGELAVLLRDTAASVRVPFFDPARVRERVERWARMDGDARKEWDPVMMLVLTSALIQARFAPAL